MRPVRVLLLLGTAAIVGLAMAVALSSATASSASPGAGLTLTPVNVKGAPASTVQVVVNVTVDGDSANAVEADINYPAGLEFQGITVNSDVWGVTASATGGNGFVSVVVGTADEITGTHRVATISFTIADSGDHVLALANSSAVVSATTNANLLAGAESRPPPNSAPGTPSTTKTTTTTTTTPGTTPTPKSQVARVTRVVINCKTPCHRSKIKALSVRFYWKVSPPNGARLTFAWRSPGGAHTYRFTRIWRRGRPALNSTALPHRLLVANALGLWRASLVINGRTIKTVQIRVAA